MCVLGTQPCLNCVVAKRQGWILYLWQGWSLILQPRSAVTQMQNGLMECYYGQLLATFYDKKMELLY